MTPRERFLKICDFALCDDPYFWSIWAWPETIDRWSKEGMPVKNLRNMKEINLHFLGFEDEIEYIPPRGSIQGMGRYGMDPWIVSIDPMFKREVIAEDDQYETIREYDGTTLRRKKGIANSIPQILDYPVKNRQDWDEYQKRLEPLSEGRWLDRWDEIRDEWLAWPIRPGFEGQSWEKRDFPVGMSLMSLYGNIRNYMGMENVSVAIYEEPEFVEEMLDRQAWLAEEMLKKVYESGVTLDWVFIWEDMCYNKGPMVSPAWFKEFMVPRYQRVTKMLKEHGCKMIAVDCDGKIDDLIPLWLESGVNSVWPLERTAGMDARKLRKEYGRDLILMGNVDKRSLAEGREAIDREVTMVEELIHTSGYFVNVDHFIPPDVSYENMKYFVDRVRALKK
ncbi:MAG TPA: hypothetical protein DF613_15670 [Lachnospiraceae bacterium]|nr:hypothetical protein [Lachnospiraceae bacterium]